ncbi:MAG: TOBE domain-containing protein [Syntrophomonadales bacterium]|jgi:molybdopterin-binding protein
MEISGRNKLPGVVKEVRLGEVAAEVVIDSGPHQIVATITRGSVENMGLKVGDNVTALIKASSVMVMK